MQEKNEVSREYSKEETNRAIMIGRIAEEFGLDHKVKRESFYASEVTVSRDDGTIDRIPIIVSEVLLNSEILSEKNTGKTVEIKGQFRSHNKLGKDRKIHLELFLFVKEIVFRNADDKNEIFLRGYLCKLPVRGKNSQNQNISELLVAVNRQYGKSDYLPCVAVGVNATRAGMRKIGDCIKIEGRMQSRKYFKKDPSNPEKGEWRKAYDIFIKKIQLIEE